MLRCFQPQKPRWPSRRAAVSGNASACAEKKETAAGSPSPRAAPHPLWGALPIRNVPPPMATEPAGHVRVATHQGLPQRENPTPQQAGTCHAAGPRPRSRCALACGWAKPKTGRTRRHFQVSGPKTTKRVTNLRVSHTLKCFRCVWTYTTRIRTIFSCFLWRLSGGPSQPPYVASSPSPPGRGH